MYEVYKNSNKKSFLVCGAHDNKREAMKWATEYFKKKPEQIEIKVGYILDDAVYFDKVDDYEFSAYVAFTK